MTAPLFKPTEPIDPSPRAAQERIAAYLRNQKPESQNRQLERALRQMGKLDDAAIARIDQVQKSKNIGFVAAAAKLGLINKADIRHALAVRHGLVRADASPSAIPRQLIVLRKPGSKAAEKFRSVRAELLTSFDPAKVETFSFASIDASHAADYVALNVASSLAQIGRRTVIVDADLRARRLETMFQSGSRASLRDVLSGKVEASDAPSESAVANLSFITAGDPSSDAQELLANGKLAEAIAELKRVYAHVLVMSAPEGNVADGRFAWKTTGGVFAVVRRHHDRMPRLQGLQSAIRSIDAEILGSLMVD